MKNEQKKDEGKTKQNECREIDHEKGEKNRRQTKENNEKKRRINDEKMSKTFLTWAVAELGSTKNQKKIEDKRNKRMKNKGERMRKKCQKRLLHGPPPNWSLYSNRIQYYSPINLRF